MFVFKIFAQIFMVLRSHKVKVFLFIFLTGVFFLFRFPYEEAVSYALNRLLRGSAIEFHYDKFYLSPLGPALVFKNPHIQFRSTGRYIQAHQLRVVPSYKALVSFKLGGGLVFHWKDSGEVLVTVRQARLGKVKAWALDLNVNHFKPSVLRSAWPLWSKFSGAISIRGQLVWDMTYQELPVGFWHLEGRGLKVQALSYTFPGTIGTISLPPFAWGRVYSRGTMKKGTILMSDFLLGKGRDAFQIKTRGLLSASIYKRSFSSYPGVRFQHYDLGLDILASEDLKSKLYFLDLFLSPVETKTSQGSRYLARIKGNKVNYFNLTKSSRLVTLKEIQNPK